MLKPDSGVWTLGAPPIARLLSPPWRGRSRSRRLFCRSIARPIRVAVRSSGLGILALAGVLQDEGLEAATMPKGSNPLAPKPTHFAPKAKRMIHIYLNGGPSQMDTFDNKPLLKKYAGKTIPTGNLRTERPTGGVLPSPFKFHRYGKSGMEISEIFDNTASTHADDLCIIRSMQCDTPNHEQSMRLMNCGDQRLSRPSLGSWLMYGMGSENRNLPGFVALCPGLPVSDVSNWRSAFLPGICQGTYVDTRKKKVSEMLPNLRNELVSGEAQPSNSHCSGNLTIGISRNINTTQTWKPV